MRGRPTRRHDPVVARVGSSPWSSRVLVVAWLAFMVWVPVNAWTTITRVDTSPTGDRPSGDTSGTTTCSSARTSRQGLTEEQQQGALRRRRTPRATRTDTIMLVHVSESGGKPVMVSLPARLLRARSPATEANKINAAYTFGGPKLLTATVENVTGMPHRRLRRDRVRRFRVGRRLVGGVDLCVPVT